MNREKFGSRLGFILVSAGCAIGLGNVWKFPYMCGQYGGALFIIFYLLFLFGFGLPIMVAEFSVGRASKLSCAKSFQKLQQDGTKWHRFGVINVVGNYVLMMFYTTVAGWMLYYCFRSLTGQFNSEVLSAEQISDMFSEMLSEPWTMVLWTAIAIAISLGICALGLKNGVERITKVMMICLLVLIVVLVVHSLTLPNAVEGVKFFFIPNLERMEDIGFVNIIFGALSQSFFTLSIGQGSMAIFGSYLGKERSLTGESIRITLLDTFVAIMAGLIIIPACFSYGVEVDSGPSLIFITLPNIFTNMAGGQVWGTLFFLFLSFAALSTVVAVFENIISIGMDTFGWSRVKSVLINFVLIFALSLPCILGFSVWSGFEPLGAGSNILDLEDFVVSNNILTLGSLIYILFVTQKSGWGWDNFLTEANTGKGIKFPKWAKWYLTIAVPIVIIVIYAGGYYEKFKNIGGATFIIWMTIAVLLLILIALNIIVPAVRKRKS